MNRDAIKLVRDHIAGLPPERFDMRHLFSVSGNESDAWWEGGKTPTEAVSGCNTAACIAGWTLAVLAPNARGESAADAAELLGLDMDDEDELFMPEGFGQEGRYTQAQAVAVLDHLLETGEVNWSLATKGGGE